MNAGMPAGKVSIIIPTFNYGHFIADCIRSVIEQDYADCEIIVVDDGSTDDTESVLQPFTSRIVYIHQDNQGLSAARNTGLKHATGDFIQFLDSDDLLGKNALQGRIDFLQRNPECSIAVCRNFRFAGLDRQGRPVKKGRWELYQSNLALHLCRFNIAPPHAFLIRKHVVDEVGEFDVSLSACEDYDYWLKAVVHGFIPQHCPDGEVLYRVHSSSMSADRKNQVRYDGELHLRLFNHVFVEKTYPMDDQIALFLAFLTGLATTLTRLQDLDDRTTTLEALKDRFEQVVALTEDSLGTRVPGNELTTRLYGCWLTYYLRRNPMLSNCVAGYHRTNQFISENLLMPAVLQNLMMSIRTLPQRRLEARRLAALTFASKFPRFAANFAI